MHHGTYAAYIGIWLVHTHQMSSFGAAISPSVICVCPSLNVVLVKEESLSESQKKKNGNFKLVYLIGILYTTH